MPLLDSILSWLGFACLLIPLLLGPWLFGAWEMWWFWPGAAFIFAGTLFGGCRLALHNRLPLPSADELESTPRVRSRRALVLLLLPLPYLAYLAVRAFQADVAMDAERIFLLALLPYLLAVHISLGFNSLQVRLLAGTLALNLGAIAVYAIDNHILTGSALVMWEPGYPQYIREIRATGPYFCPDHLAGAMELALCIAFGFLLSRRTKGRVKLCASALCLLALATIVLTKSRGGGLTVLAIIAGILVWGFAEWPQGARWSWRVFVVSVVALVLFLFASIDTGYTRRFKTYFKTAEGQQESAVKAVAEQLSHTSRGRMYRAAWRAWSASPGTIAWGVGPGMHQNLWPHIGPTPDGDRERGIWPSETYVTFYSFEVHNDWLQLLEEQGLVGFLLFLVPCLALPLTLRRLLPSHRSYSTPGKHVTSGPSRHPFVVAALLAFVAMAFHSFGDFNLQIPANGWMFAAILSLGLWFALRRSH